MHVRDIQPEALFVPELQSCLHAEGQMPLKARELQAFRGQQVVELTFEQVLSLFGLQAGIEACQHEQDQTEEA